MGETYSVTLTAKDSTGGDITTGGATFVIRIYNEFTTDSDFGCVENTGAKQVVLSTIFGTMSDNGDGSYFYSFIPEDSGSVTIKILHTTEGIDSKFYTNQDYIDPPEIHNVTNDINYNWGSGSPVSEVNDFSSVLDFYFVPEESTDYIFKLTENRNSYLYSKETRLVEAHSNSTYTSVSNINNIIIANICIIRTQVLWIS